MSLQERATDTSREAYRRANADGTISASQWRVLSALRKYGPSTARELAKASAEVDDRDQKRFSELCELGLVIRMEARACGVTGRKAQVWRATDSRTQEAAPNVGPRGSMGGGAPAVGSTGAVLPAAASMSGALEKHARDPERGTLYRGGSKVGLCPCGTVNWRFHDKCGQEHCCAEGHACPEVLQ